MGDGLEKPRQPDEVTGELPGALDRTPTLREMADVEALRELCENVSRLIGLGVALYDLEGAAVVEPAPIPAYCEKRCREHGEADRCDTTKRNVAQALSFDDRVEARGCFT